MNAVSEPNERKIDWTAIRRDFPILDQEINGHPLIYFDNAATSQKPQQVLDAVDRYFQRDNANVHRGIHELSNRATAAYEAARERSAKFINAASSEEIIFTRGTTESINLVATAWGNANLKPGDRILLTEIEHHSNIVAWQLLAQRTGAELVYVPVTGDEGTLDLSNLDALLDGRTKIFSFTHISNTMGVINPVREFCEQARQHGVVTFVDAAQSGGHFPVDVREIGCDFLALSGHKICAPTGIGLLYGRKEILEAMPPYHGGGEMIESVGYFDSTWNSVPHKFEAGTPNMGGAIGLHAAMDYLDAIGREAIFQHDQDLAIHFRERLLELGNVRIFGPASDRSGVISFLLDDVHAHDLCTLADQKGLALRGGHHCNQPLMGKLGTEATARASFYFYNTREEVDRAIEIIAKIQKMLGR